jgi:hypothetical protein
MHFVAWVISNEVKMETVRSINHNYSLNISYNMILLNSNDSSYNTVLTVHKLWFEQYIQYSVHSSNSTV